MVIKMNQKEKIDLLQYIPEFIYSGMPQKQVVLHKKIEDDFITLWYYTEQSGFKGSVTQHEYAYYLPRYISWSKETFEVLGLLQAEMGKTQNGNLTFCNHEYQIIKRVMVWFQKELMLFNHNWKWYIKVNINEPNELIYKKTIETKLVNYWISKTKIDPKMMYPHPLSYVKHNDQKILKNSNYGTLILDFKNNIFSQIIKNYVNQLSHSILTCGEDEIKYFMKGIIAGESNVEIEKPTKHFRIFISAKEFEERELYQNCLKRLRISSINYLHFHGLVVSSKENLLQLLDQKLMSGSKQKYEKFLQIKTFYENDGFLQQWKQKVQGKPHNKTPQSKIDEILSLHSQHPGWSAWKIAEIVGTSSIKVQRVRKEHGIEVQRQKKENKLKKTNVFNISST